MVQINYQICYICKIAKIDLDKMYIIVVQYKYKYDEMILM